MLKVKVGKIAKIGKLFRGGVKTKVF